MTEKSIIIIGAGIAGLSAGIYAQANGYRTRIFEQHTVPGGLCTAWKRKGYIIDGCIHWLVGSSPANAFYTFWQEVGLIQGARFIDQEIFMRYEGKDGRVFNLYTDVDRLERHMLELSPADRRVIKEFTGGIRFFCAYDPPLDVVPELMGPLEGVKLMARTLPALLPLGKWLKITGADFAARFKDETLREGLLSAWYPNFSMLFLLMTFAWLHKKTAGYPLGGSLPLAQAMAQRYLQLGGEIEYGQKVTRILVEGGTAVGVCLADGSEQRADVIVSAADGHATIFDMLEGRYVSARLRQYYDQAAVFPPLVLVALGVARSFDGEPQTVSGVNFPLKSKAMLGNRMVERLTLHAYNFDPTLAPEGKTLLTVYLDADYDYWKDLAADRERYEARKEEILQTVIALLDQRYPGLAAQVEMGDVATPLTFERYTGNWKGSFEGWMLTPEMGMAQIAKTLPGLSNFYMVGQWVEPGGGLPSAVRSGRNLAQILCRRDGVVFRPPAVLG